MGKSAYQSAAPNDAAVRWWLGLSVGGFGVTATRLPDPGRVDDGGCACRTEGGDHHGRFGIAILSRISCTMHVHRSIQRVSDCWWAGGAVAGLAPSGACLVVLAAGAVEVSGSRAARRAVALALEAGGVASRHPP